jgi:hypothetical protein
LNFLLSLLCLFYFPGLFLRAQTLFLLLAFDTPPVEVFQVLPALRFKAFKKFAMCLSAHGGVSQVLPNVTGEPRALAHKRLSSSENAPSNGGST